MTNENGQWLPHYFAQLEIGPKPGPTAVAKLDTSRS